MVEKDGLDGYDPVAAGEQAEDGTDLFGIRHNLSLSVSERIEQHRRAGESMQWIQKLRNAPRSTPAR